MGRWRRGVGSALTNVKKREGVDWGKRGVCVWRTQTMPIEKLEKQKCKHEVVDLL